MERQWTHNHSRLVTFITLAAVVMAAMSQGARSPRQRNHQAVPRWSFRQDRQRYRQTNDDGYRQQDAGDYYYHDDDEGSCDIEVACRTETDEAIEPTSMKLPIRGPVGPPGQRGPAGKDGLPGRPGLPGE